MQNGSNFFLINIVDVFTVCPFILLTPSFLETDYGQRAIYTGFVEAKLEPGLKARWQFIHNGIEQDIDIHTGKYNGSRLLPSLTLIINNAVFEDEGSYRLQVLIRDGWCSSTEVQLRKVRGSKFSVKIIKICC